MADLCKLYSEEPALYELEFKQEGFQWIDCSNRDASTLSYLRRAKNPNNYLVVVCNFTPNTPHNFWVGVPEDAEYREIFNSDSCYYGGSGQISNQSVFSQPVPCQGFAHHIEITLPPLGVVVLKPVR